MPKHTPAKRAENRRRAFAKARKKLGATFTEKEGAALLKAEAAASGRKAGRKKTVSGLARNAAAKSRKRQRRRATFE